MKIPGIDVSAWQGSIDWTKIKEAGIKFAILKAGGADDGYYKDSRFEYNYSECKRLGISVGAYYFMGPKATTAAEGKKEAGIFLELLKGKQFDYPVYADVEAQHASKKAITDAVIAFAETLEDAGYFAGVYGSTVAGFQDRMDDSRLKAYTHWVADYRGQCYYKGDYGIWQYTSSRTLAGIRGRVDGDWSYIDFPSVIIKKGFNGYGKAPAPKPASDPEPEPVYYKIVSGDTLGKIAKKYKTTAKKIQALNPDKIKNINLIYAGDTIRVK